MQRDLRVTMKEKSPQRNRANTSGNRRQRKLFTTQKQKGNIFHFIIAIDIIAETTGRILRSMI